MAETKETRDCRSLTQDCNVTTEATKIENVRAQHLLLHKAWTITILSRVDMNLSRWNVFRHVHCIQVALSCWRCNSISFFFRIWLYANIQLRLLHCLCRRITETILRYFILFRWRLYQLWIFDDARLCFLIWWPLQSFCKIVAPRYNCFARNFFLCSIRERWNLWIAFTPTMAETKETRDCRSLTQDCNVTTEATKIENVRAQHLLLHKAWTITILSRVDMNLSRWNVFRHVHCIQVALSCWRCNSISFFFRIWLYANIQLRLLHCLCRRITETILRYFILFRWRLYQLWTRNAAFWRIFWCLYFK